MPVWLELAICFAVLCVSEHAAGAAAAGASQVFRATFAPPVPPPSHLFERMAGALQVHEAQDALSLSTAYA
jgi:hypothetical protein